jgi:hypothetical protein
LTIFGGVRGDFKGLADKISNAGIGSDLTGLGLSGGGFRNGQGLLTEGSSTARFIADADGGIKDLVTGRGNLNTIGKQGSFNSHVFSGDGMRVINIGAGENPLIEAGVINADPRNLPGIDIVASANKIDLPNAFFDEAISINPFGFNPLRIETARILKPGRTLTVVGQPKNFELRRLNRLSPEVLRRIGFEKISPGLERAEERFRFGEPKTTRGEPIAAKAFKQLVFRRLP